MWALLADLEAVQRYNPGVETATIEGRQRTGVGAKRACVLVPKGRVVERVTHWEERRAMGLEVAESDWPIHFMRWVTVLEDQGGATLITQQLEYKVKYGPLGWALDQLVMKKQLTSSIDKVLAQLVEHAEAAR